ncbi:SDR family NAD(P)-dependent oxidoreductase [Streptomyces sp. NPDC002952]|uniref:SDR family NAD(P)-dependent oxidoreductase n=1 Tax=Streptomyces sp. NPDC002952 TaxID=3364673 RepID=UPI0036A06336
MKNAFGVLPTVLVLGGTSDIALALCRELARRGTRTIILAGRDADALAARAALLETQGPRVHTVPFDADDTEGHEAFMQESAERFGDLDLVVLAFGVLGEPRHLAASHAASVECVRTTFLGAVSVLHAAVRTLRGQGHGTVVVLSSAAARRPRPANYTYAAAKAGVDTYALGLAQSLGGTGVRIVLVRPGFVRTAMTAGLAAPPLATTAAAVAKETCRTLTSTKDVVWVPARVGWAVLLLQHLPAGILRRLPYS